jgi:signal transduction histidine kinase
MRLARDLHDGVLQSFTGVALRLEAVRRMMGDERSPVTDALSDVQRILASEQRDIRFFIEELRPAPHPADEAALEDRLTDLAVRMEREWDLHVELTLAELDSDLVPAALARDVYHIVREALMNAARHGAASVARVGVTVVRPGALRIRIADNGRGFAFSGRYSTEELIRLDLGPRTLRERVREMQGSLVLESGPAGAELNLTLPLAVVA